MRIPVTKDGQVDLQTMVSDMWGILFTRPDPLGYCIIQMDMYRVMKISSMSLDEKQRYKGRK